MGDVSANFLLYITPELLAVMPLITCAEVDVSTRSRTIQGYPLVPASYIRLGGGGAPAVSTCVVQHLVLTAEVTFQVTYWMRLQQLDEGRQAEWLVTTLLCVCPLLPKKTILSANCRMCSGDQ